MTTKHILYSLQYIHITTSKTYIVIKWRYTKKGVFFLPGDALLIIYVKEYNRTFIFKPHTQSGSIATLRKKGYSVLKGPS